MLQNAANRLQVEACGSEMLQIACKLEAVTLKCCNSMQMGDLGGNWGTIPLGEGGTTEPGTGHICAVIKSN